MQEYVTRSLKYHPIPKPTCHYYELHEHNPFVISEPNMDKLSGLCKVFLVKLTQEMLDKIDVIPSYGRRMFGHSSSELGVNIFLDGLFVVTRMGSGFKLTQFDKKFCEAYHNKVSNTFKLFKYKMLHALHCNE